MKQQGINWEKAMSFKDKTHAAGSNAKRSSTIKDMYKNGKPQGMGFSKKYITEDQQRRARLSRQLKCRYGITMDDYDALFERQDSSCAICGHKFEYTLYVDHDHDTGRVRGLLCQPCNSLIGFAKDSQSVLAEASIYLSSNKTVGGYANNTLMERLYKDET